MATISRTTLPTGQKVAVLPSLLTAVNRLQQAVEVGNAVLVEGPSGCGKTTIINTLAVYSEGGDNTNRKPHLVTLHLGEHTDAKMLVGTYQCTGVPGEFEWKPGILTRTVLEGWWLLLEDLNQATADIVSLLLPLVKHGHLLLPGHTHPLSAASNFKLICTKRSAGTVLFKTNLLEVLEDHLFVLHLEPLLDDDVKQIISVLYPDLSELVDKLVGMFHSVGADLRSCLKLCGRLVAHVTNGRTTSREEILLECLDCLLANKPQDDVRLKLCHVINEHLTNLSREKVEYLNTLHKPSVQIILGSTVSVGRAFLPSSASNSMEMSQFAHTRQSLLLLESVGRCVQQQEPVLLVGETGVGKTALISYLASITGHKLVVVNMSQQSDSTDLLGGFKPVEMSSLVFPVKEKFEGLFRKTFSTKKNQDFLIHLQEVYAKHHWKTFFKIIVQSAKSGLKRCQKQSVAHMIAAWEGLLKDAVKMQRQLMKNATVVFAFIEGALVEALHNGWWILLDEVNLATAETLQCLSSLLENQHGSFLLPERGDYQPVVRHEDFRLFACMNPATDVGKKALPYSIRNRFTELYVNELQSNDDLRKLILTYTSNVQLSEDVIQGIIKFYKVAKELAESKLSDGTGRKPLFSMRTLCRSLQYVARNPCGNVYRSLYEGLCMGFQSQLKKDQYHFIIQLTKTTLPLLSSTVVQAAIPRPKGDHIQVEGFWLPVGSSATERSDQYVLTTSVRSNLKDIARVVTARNHPVLLQGPTSAGKTSLVQWLAKATGHECLRINNHEHTDLQEYVGMYTANSQGQLVFQEGVLVEAMRKGSWIILDELNLAPTDVLEALNRVLDDNRELFIPETRQLVKAHPHFMLFGTQNPPGLYGGRKVLSRAFRNRFVELHFDDIPAEELVTILYQRCKLPESYAKKLVAVMKELQQRRSDSILFAGKYGLITLRDLFRWAERYRRSPNTTTPYDWEQQLADDGYLLLAGKVRTSAEEDVIRTTVEKHFKRQINPSSLFGHEEPSSHTTVDILTSLLHGQQSEQFGHLVWTHDLKRLAVLLGRAVKFDEPVLLVGETGCGKTTLCQLFASILGRKLYSINCHMHTEAADFLGGLRPARRRQDDDNDEESEAKLFEWSDGILVHAMQEGSCLLIDEISLADDAVLERLNSVLEPERTLLVAEKGCSSTNQPYLIKAEEGFVLMATMNPGGDYGKKELSPALRNRFTEIWCPSSTTQEDYQQIACHNLLSCFTGEVTEWSHVMVEYLHWFQQRRSSHRSCVSVRDLLSWITFMNTVSTRLTQPAAFYHGARLVFIDSLVSDDGDLQQLNRDRNNCLKYLEGQLVAKGLYDSVNIDVTDHKVELTDDEKFGIEPFCIVIGTNEIKFPEKYSLSATGPKCNAFRLLRALQLLKPILLEGTPGVGKTSLVMALGQASGHNVVRINLSEQTDISDLFGSDLPVESRKKITFKWKDGPFLKALKKGDWILLDEMNLASQSVLEGLNACLDHRGEIYIPELDMTFLVKTDTRLFACQNPQYQGSGRKGLPRSFLNRFSRVYVEPLCKEDLQFIISTMYPMLSNDMIESMVTFNQQVADVVMKESSDLWEFNIRDVLRWCELMIKHQIPNQWDPGQFIDLIYTRRLRNPLKRKEVESLFVNIFATQPSKPGRYFHITDTYLQVGRAVIKRAKRPIPVNSTLLLLHSQLPLLELLMYCVDIGHMSILVGGNSAGKVSIVQCLAQLTGHKLVEFPMNSETDTTELLGGFEQVNYNRDLVNLREELKENITCFMFHGEIKDHNKLIKLNNVVQELEELCLTRVLTGNNEESLISQCNNLQKIIEDLTNLKLQRLKSNIKTFRKKLAKLSERINNDDSSGQFHWMDSVLVKALREGHWLLISNANFCSASVLDRLNAVLEPGGVLTLDEKGTDGDVIPSIKPHPSFRLFLTMNSKYGEISRAMRNRGVELFMLPEDQLDNKYSDLAALLHHSGIEDMTTVTRLIEFHKQVVQLRRGQGHVRILTAIQETINAHRPPSIPQLLQAAKLYQSSDKVPTSLHDCISLSYCLHDTAVLVLSQEGLDNGVIMCGDGNLWSVANLTDNPTAAVVTASCMPLNVSLKHCNEGQLPFIRAQMSILLKTAFIDDYQARVKALDAMETDCGYCDLHTMVQSVKASSDIMMSSVMMQRLQQLMCDLSVEHKLSLSLDMDPLTTYQVKGRPDIVEKVKSLLSLERFAELLVAFRNHIAEGNTKRSRLSLLQLACAAYRGRIPIDSLPDANLLYIYPLLKQLYDNLSQYVKKQSALEILQVFNGLYWLEIFQDFCCQPVGRDFSVGLFATVWSIWYNHSTEHFINPIINWSEKSSTDLMDALKHLEIFSAMFSAGRLLSTVRTKLGHPAVFACEETANIMVKLLEAARHLGTTSNDMLLYTTSQSELTSRSQLLEYYQTVWLCNHHQKALPKGMKTAIQEFVGSIATVTMCGSEGTGLLLQPVVYHSMNIILTTLFEALSSNDVSLLTSIHSDVGGFLQYLLHHTTTDCTQLLPLSVLLHIIDDSVTTKSNTILLATKQLIFPLLHSYSSGLYDINNVSCTDNDDLCQYRSIVTEYCLDMLCCKLQPGLLPMGDHGITVSNRQRHCEELQQLLNHLWSFCCTPLNDRDHHHKKLLKILQQQFLYIVQQLTNVCWDINQSTDISDINQKLLELSIVHISNEDIHVITQVLTSQTTDSVTIELLTDIEKCLSKCLALFRECLNMTNKVGEGVTDDLQYMLVCEKLKTYLSMAEVLLCDPVSPVDHVMYHTVKHDCLQSVIDREKYLLLAYDQHYRTMTGSGIFDHYNNNPTDITGIPTERLTTQSYENCSLPVQEIICNLSELESKQKSDCRVKSVFRPSSSEHSTLVQLCKDVVSRISSLSNVEALLSSDDHSMDKVVIWRNSVMSAIKKLLSDHPLYPDIVVPFTASMMQLVNGVSATAWLQQQLVVNQCGILNTVGNLLEPPMRNVCSKLRPNNDIKMLEGGRKLSSEFMQCILRSCFDHLAESPALTNSWRDVIVNVLLNYANTWKLSEEAARQKSELEASLYKYKPHTHIIENDSSEDDIINHMFPDYEAEFSRNDDNTEPMECDDKAEESSATAIDCTVSADVMVEVCVVHLLSSNVPTDHIPLLKCLQYKSSLLLGYLLAGSLTKQLITLPGMTVEQCSMGSHILACSNILDSMECATPEESSDYNIYTDPNVTEVTKCCPILNALIQSVNSLLDQWPDHPILNQIKEATIRVLSLSINVPVMKALTGLEYILKKAQDWEAYASSKVSLAVHLTEITNLVVEWRRKELSHWGNLLTSCRREVEKTASKWWFHLYHLIQECCSDKDEDSFTKFSQTIQQFMEWSSLGEYNYRLVIIEGFASGNNVVNITAQVQAVLWNTHHFYRQFVTTVEQAIERLSLPVVKEFKEYMSIVRWNDGTYWALKTKTDKGKRVLAKLTTKFKEILQQPANAVITDSSLTSESRSLETETSKLQQFYDAFISTAFPKPSIAVDEATSFSVSLTTDSGVTTLSSTALINRLQVLVRESLSSKQFREIIITVDEFTGVIINTVKHLTQTAYIHDLPMEKRTAAVKSNISQKQKALSDLFKSLKTLGLSYRKGLQSLNHLQEMYFSLPILECSNVLSGKLSVILMESNSYYFKCVARHRAFLNITTPSKKLTLGQISRCKGFAADILHKVTKQRFTLSSVLKDYECLWHFENTLDSLSMEQENDQLVFSTAVYDDWLECLYQCSEEIQAALKHCKQLLEAVPFDNKVKPIALPFTELPSFLGANREEICKNCLERIKVMMDTNTTLLVDVAKNITSSNRRRMTSNTIATRRDCQYLADGYSEMDHMVTSLLTLKDELLGTDHSHVGVFQFIQVTDFVSDKVHSFQQWHNDSVISQDCNSKHSEELSELIKSSFNTVLMASQYVIKQYNMLQSNVIKSDEDSDNIEQWEKAYTAVMMVANSSDSQKVCSSITEVMDNLNNVFSQNKIDSTILQLLYQLQLSVKEYNELINKLLVDLLATHRTMCKLSSVFFAVFATIFSKGFCAEELDVAEETEGEGATDFVDTEGGGFDEGTGATNVSKDCQDLQEQLENATQKEPSSEEQKENNINDDKEDDGVEMSEDFEGTVVDLPEQEEEEDSSDDDDGDDKNEDIADKMGELENKEQEGLDKNMWAPEDEDNKELSESQDNVDGGVEIKGSDEIVAKDDALKKQDNPSKDDPVPDTNGEEEFEEQNPDDYKSSDPLLDEQFNPQDIQDIPETDFHLDDGDKDIDDDDDDDVEEIDGAGFDNEDNKSSSDGDAEETEETIQDKDLATDVDEENNDKEQTDEVQSDWQPDLTKMPSGDNQQAVDSHATSNAPSTEAQQNDELNSVEENVNTEELCGNTESAAISSDTMDTSDNMQLDSQRKSSDRRTLADDDHRPVKKPRIVNDDIDNNKESTDPSETQNQEDDATYKHIEEDQNTMGSASVWDAATKEQLQQRKQQQQQKEMEEKENSVEPDAARRDENASARNENKTTKSSSSRKVDNTSTPEDSEASDNEKDEPSKHDDVVTMDTVESYYCTEASLLNVHRVDPRKEDLLMIREQIEEATRFLHSTEKSVDTVELWLQYESLTIELAHMLYERIRLTFQPTQASQLKGDYKTGKRLNMRRIIPYIASHYQNDRIWLRRSKPSKMHYQLLIAIDDSYSMQDNECKQTAYESLAVISGALCRLDGAQLGICRFGSEVDVLHKFTQQFTTSSGAFILEQMSFQQPKTNFVKLLEVSRALFIDNAQHSVSNTTSSELHQLLVILSDGRGVFAEGTLSIQIAVRKLQELGVFVVFIILDPLHKDSILDIRVPIFSHGQPIQFKSYLDMFPFPFYLVLKEIRSMPTVLGDALQQWFQLINDKHFLTV